MLLIAGFSNAVFTLITMFFVGDSVINYFWIILGGVQIYWGITTIISFTKINKNQEKNKWKIKF